MSYLAGEDPFLCQVVAPPTQLQYDPELDEAVSTLALQRGTMAGRCNLVGLPVTFTVNDTNLRENVIADVSGSHCRHRLLACALSQAMFGTPLVSLPSTAGVMNARRSRMFLTETTTPLNRAMQSLLAPELLIASEYFGDAHSSGDVINGTRHEDLQHTSFADDSFDYIITSDVMEHVPDAPAAEREIVRILKPGGFYCFTAPMNPSAEEDQIRARLRDDGTIEHLVDPIYHGDPLRPEGVLVFRIFSIPAMTARFAEYGATCTTYHLWSKTYGLIGPGCWIHIVEKAAPRR